MSFLVLFCVFVFSFVMSSAVVFFNNMFFVIYGVCFFLSSLFFRVGFFSLLNFPKVTVDIYIEANDVHMCRTSGVSY